MFKRTDDTYNTILMKTHKNFIFGEISEVEFRYRQCIYNLASVFNAVAAVFTYLSI